MNYALVSMHDIIGITGLLEIESKVDQPDDDPRVLSPFQLAVGDIRQPAGEARIERLPFYRGVVNEILNDIILLGSLDEILGEGLSILYFTEFIKLFQSVLKRFSLYHSGD